MGDFECSKKCNFQFEVTSFLLQNKRLQNAILSFDYAIYTYIYT